MSLSRHLTEPWRLLFHDKLLWLWWLNRRYRGQIWIWNTRRGWRGWVSTLYKDKDSKEIWSRHSRYWWAKNASIRGSSSLCQLPQTWETTIRSCSSQNHVFRYARNYSASGSATLEQVAARSGGIDIINMFKNRLDDYWNDVGTNSWPLTPRIDQQ